MKKILALLMACALLVSMTCMVSASTGATISVSNLTAADIVEDADAGNYYMVAVNMDKLYTDSTTLSLGYNAMQFDLVYDEAIVAPHDYGVWGTDDGWGWSFKQGPTWKKEALSASSAIVTVDGKKAIRVVMQTGSVTKTLLNRGAGDQSLLYFAFAPVAEFGKGEFAVKNIVFSVADESALHYDADFTIVNGSIDLGEDPNAGGNDPVKPETSVVKTFPKRFYADNALTTVGVIVEGTDYDNATAVEAGVNVKADKDGEEVILPYITAPIASDSDEDKSYIIVTLGGISDTTKVKATSATQAYIDIDGTVIAGDYVSENATVATDVVTDADFVD